VELLDVISLDLTEVEQMSKIPFLASQAMLFVLFSDLAKPHLYPFTCIWFTSVLDPSSFTLFVSLPLIVFLALYYFVEVKNSPTRVCCLRKDFVERRHTNCMQMFHVINIMRSESLADILTECSSLHLSP